MQNQEDEDEMNGYASYRNLDPDYVEYLKELRRAKRLGQRTPVVPTKASSSVKEIPVTPNIGLTSITNTNVLVNDTLERMKYSLNKINTQLTEKKGQTFEGNLFTE